MLDVKEALKDFKPIDIETIEMKSGKLPEKIAEAIKLYNRALEDIQFKSEDIAIIALKKAISLHPVFYEAMNLLGLCYAMVGKEEEAKASFQRVIEADDSSIRALEYLKKMQSQDGEEEIKETPARKSRKTGSRSGLAGSLARGLGPEDNNKFYFVKYIAGIIIGVIITSVIWCMVPTDRALFRFEKVENIVKDPELVEEIAFLNGRIEELEQDLKNKNEENLKLSYDFQVYREWVNRLNEANREYQDGNYTGSASLLYDTQGTDVPEDLYDYYKSLWDVVRIRAAEDLYREGNKLYNGNRNKDPEIYRQAWEKYETCISYIGDEKVSYLSNLYYQAGKAAARCDEKDRAMELFEYIINEYPNTSMSSYATARLNELKAGKEISGS